MSLFRLLARIVLCATVGFSLYASASASAAPPMGWSSWNSLEERVNFATIKAEADGLAALNARIPSGPTYEFVNIDEGWWTSGQRDADGNFVIDKTQWPGGMQSIASYIHSKHLKAGIYIDAGPRGCGKRADGTHFVGSDYAHYEHDFLQFAQWGFDFVKVDFCGGTAAGYDPVVAYSAVSRAVRNAHEQTGHALTLSVCDWGYIPLQSSFPDFLQGPWDWAPGLATMWRTTGDIYQPGSKGPDANGPRFSYVMANELGNYHPESQHTGYYNDPDMMVLGMGLTPSQDRSHVSMWAISGAPLILGNDLAKPLDAQTVALVTNPEVLAVDQDPLGLQGVLLLARPDGMQIWSKLLAGSGERAVLFFNGSSSAQAMRVTWQQLGLRASRATVRDLWEHKELGTYGDSYETNVPAGEAVMLKVSGSDTHSTTYKPARSLDSSMVSFGNVLSSSSGGFVRVTFVNRSTQPSSAQLRVNGGSPSVVLFQPTRGLKTVTLYTSLEPGKNDLTFSSVDAETTAIASLETIAGPTAFAPFQATYEAEDPRNTLTGDAMVVPCRTCSNGYGVRSIGLDSTLTFNNISVPADGVYTVDIGYVTEDQDPRAALISFNGAAPVAVNFPSTGGPVTILRMQVTGFFKTGSGNSLTISNPRGDAPDIDGIGAPVLLNAVQSAKNR